MRRYLVVFGSLLLATSAAAQAPDRLAPRELKWKQIMPGVSFAPAYGDWEKGAHGKFVRLGLGVKVPPHTHTQPYDAVLISGRLANSVDGDLPADVRPGGYWHMAGNRVHAHECVSNEPCIFYTHSNGLWDVKVVEPK